MVFYTLLLLISLLPTWPKLFAPAGGWMVPIDSHRYNVLPLQAVNRGWGKRSSSETVRVSDGGGVEEGGKGKMKVLSGEINGWNPCEEKNPSWEKSQWYMLSLGEVQGKDEIVCLAVAKMERKAWWDCPSDNYTRLRHTLQKKRHLLIPCRWILGEGGLFILSRLTLMGSNDMTDWTTQGTVIIRHVNDCA